MSDEEKILGKAVRVLMKIGGSLVIAVPKDYIKAHGLKKGDRMTLFYNDVLHAEPVTKEEIARKIGLGLSSTDGGRAEPSRKTG